jgi:hypothetical protein
LLIPAAAKVCTNCDSAQSRGIRWLGRIGVAGAALAALLPLADGAWSLREIAKGRHAADVRVRPIACAAEGITLAVMNFGRGPAVLSSPVFTIDGTYAGDASSISLRSDKTATVLAPSEVQTLQLTGWAATVSTDLPRATAGQVCAYVTTLTVEDVDSTTHPDAKCPCPVG